MTRADRAILWLCLAAALGGLALRFLGIGVLVRGYL
jgi:hypothetical protein